MAAIALASGAQLLYIPGIQAFNVNSPDPADPTSLPVYVAFLPHGTNEPGVSDWLAAQWLPFAAANPQTARISVNPATLSLVQGRYDIWLKITGATEQPAGKVGTLVVT